MNDHAFHEKGQDTGMAMNCRILNLLPILRTCGKADGGLREKTIVVPRNMTYRAQAFVIRNISHNSDSLRGFTLLELIIAITILSIVTLIIGSAFSLGMKAWEKGETETQETQRLRALSGLISQSIKSAYPYKMKINDEEVVVFEGDENSILFVTAHNSSFTGGFKWVRYSYRDGALVFTEGILPDKEFMIKIKEHEEVIDADIGDIKFEYLRTSEDGWQDELQLGDGLPAAVRVKVAYFQPFFISIPMGMAEMKKETIQ